MKKIKLEHYLAELVRQGEKTATWRFYDDKDLSVGDKIVFVDKVDSGRPETWAEFGPYVIRLIVEKQLGDVEGADFEGHERFASNAEMLATYQKYYGPQVDVDTPVKMVHFVPTDSDASGSNAVVKHDSGVDKKSTDVHEAKLYADGGSRGNPGPSASGFVIMTTTGKILERQGAYLGVTTNNQAEYQALKLGLEAALSKGIGTVHVYMDSLLVINQMLGIFKVKNRDLWPIHDAVKHVVAKFKQVTFSHIPRELNKLADRAVNDALDDAERHRAQEMV